MNKYLAIYSLAPLLLIGCVGNQYNNVSGHSPVYENPASVGQVSGIGIDTNDIVVMTDKMIQSMLQNPLLANRQPVPRIIIDSTYFKNESSSRINKNMITDRLRVELNKAANGRILFIARHYGDMVDKERLEKREGKLTEGSIGMAQAKAGADFRLGGRITSQDSLRHRTGKSSRYHQILFEMVDLEVGAIVWSNMYEFKKTAQDDVVYR